MRQSDHDLLIALNVKFDENGKAMDRLHEKVTKFFSVTATKADRNEVESLKLDHHKIELRVKAIEDENTLEEGQKQGRNKAGEFSIKTWGIISGIVFLAITVIQFLSNK